MYIVSTAASVRRSVLDRDRKSTRLNSSHGSISYAVFCLKKKKLTRRGRCNTHRPARSQSAAQGSCMRGFASGLPQSVYSTVIFFFYCLAPPRFLPLSPHAPLPV